MLKNKFSYYFWRVAIGVSIGLILMFARGKAYALSYDLEYGMSATVFTTNSLSFNKTVNGSDITQTLTFNNLISTVDNQLNKYVAVFGYSSMLIGHGDETASWDITDFNYRINLIATEGAWSNCEAQNNYIVCPLETGKRYTGLRFYFGAPIYPGANQGDIISFNVRLNTTVMYFKPLAKETAQAAQESAEANKQTAQNTKKIADEISDNSDPTIDVSGMSGVTGLLPAGPLDSLLALPANLLTILVNSTSGSCQPFTFTFVFDSEWQLPCFDTFWNQVPAPLLLFMSDLPAVYIFIKWAKSIYKRVERAVSFESSVEDEWGGV